MKTRIDVIASEESYQNLSTFSDIEEMNKTVRIYRDVIRASVKRADVQARLIALLETLKRHSCKYVGVSYMYKNTIASKMELSYKTVQRLVKKLVDLGMIRQVPTKRKKDMLQTANAIIILPAKKMSDKNQEKSPAKCPTIKTKSIYLKQKIINKRKSAPVTDHFANANFIAAWVPDRFANLANCFYHKAETINELWKVVRQNNRVVNYASGERAFTTEQEVEIGVKALKEFAMKIKSGLRIRNMFGYFNGIVDNLMDNFYFDANFMDEYAELWKSNEY